MSDALKLSAIEYYIGETHHQFKTIEVLSSIGSTNDRCLQQCKENKALPFACIADVQSGGKGRRGRHWVSTSGSSITMSFATSFDLNIEQLGMLSLAIGMTTVDVLREFGLKNVMLKWPNDVIVNHQKIAGILIETVNVNNQLNVVIGLGVNYRLPNDSADSIPSPWTDVVQCLGIDITGGRNALAGKLLQECLKMCEQYSNEIESLSIKFDCSYNAYIDEIVNVVTNSGVTLEGLCVGTTANGELRVMIGQQEQTFNSAEVSMRKTT